MGDEPEICTKISEKVKMAGFLEKKGSMLWKKYWFVLEDRLLLYYKSQIEYVNLSPCRGSLNMGLVSSVQPRRNSREPVIHLVTRSTTLFLRAKNRQVQEKWLQSLLDSMGRQGITSFRFSLDDIPGEIQAMTLPRRFHTGSLDAVWKPTPVIPKSKMLDKVLGYEEETDENQNQDPYGALNKERKSQTLDSRRVDSKLEKLRNALARRKSNTTLEPEVSIPKIRRESFITKMFKKSPTKLGKEVEVQDSDAEDPLYDKIENVKGKIDPKQQNQKQLFGTKVLLPEGTMAELKNKLLSRESLTEVENECESIVNIPPALPPRGPSNSMLALNDSTTVAIVHSPADEGGDDVKPEVEDSEDSEISGHYQVIHNNNKQRNDDDEKSTEFREEIKPAEEVQYQVINKDKKRKKKKEIEKNSEIILRIDEPNDNSHVDKTEDAVNKNEIKEDVKGADEQEAKKSGEICLPLINSEHVVHIVVEGIDYTKETKEMPEEIDPYETIGEIEVKNKNKEPNSEPQETKAVTNEDEIDPYETIGEVKEANEESKQELEVDKSPTDELEEMKVVEDEPKQKLEEKDAEPELNNKNVYIEEKEFNEKTEEPVIDSELVETEIHKVIVTPEIDSTLPLIEIKEQLIELSDSNFKNIIKIDESKEKDDITDGLSDLNSLLLRLVEITTAPLAVRDGQNSWTGLEEGVGHVKLKRSYSDPDYDVPRPHAPLILETASEQDRLPATEFFTKSDEHFTPTSTNSLEPDSLETKKEECADLTDHPQI